LFSGKQAETLQDFTANGKYAAKDGLTPASAVYLFSLTDTQFYFSRSKGQKLSLATGNILPCPATDTFSVLSARTLAFGRILPHTTGSLLLARKFPAFILQPSR
jgi:hypothetical protein